jgi:hypothetical protein
LRRQCIRHEIAIGLRNFLDLRPPVRELARGETHLGAQQQQVEAGAEARLFKHAQCAPAARLFERGCAANISHAQGKALQIEMRPCAWRAARSTVSTIVRCRAILRLLR